MIGQQRRGYPSQFDLRSRFRIGAMTAATTEISGSAGIDKNRIHRHADRERRPVRS